MAVPENTPPFSNDPPGTNVIDADAVNEKFDRLYDYLQAGIEKVGSLPACSVYSSGAAVNPTGAWQTLSFNGGTEEFDIGGLWTTNANNFVVPVSGVYAVTAHVRWGSTSGPQATRTFGISLNGGQPLDHRTHQAYGQQPYNGEVSALLKLVAGDQLSIQAVHDFAGIAINARPRMAIAYHSAG